MNNYTMDWVQRVDWSCLDEQKTELVLNSSIEAAKTIGGHISSVNSKAAALIGFVPVCIGLSVHMLQAVSALAASALIIASEVLVFIAGVCYLCTLKGQPVFSPYRRACDLLQGEYYKKNYLQMVHSWIPAMDKEITHDQKILFRKNRLFNTGNFCLIAGSFLIVLASILMMFF